MQGQQNIAQQGQQEYPTEGQGYTQQGQQEYVQDGQQYTKGQQEYAPQGQQNYAQGQQGLDYPQPATLREGGVAAVHPGGVHEVPLHDSHPVHTVVPPVSTTPVVAQSTEKRPSGTGTTRAPGAATGASSSSGGKVAGLALGMITFLLLLFLVLWEIVLVALASRILHHVRNNGGDLQRLRG